MAAQFILKLPTSIIRGELLVIFFHLLGVTPMSMIPKINVFTTTVTQIAGRYEWEETSLFLQPNTSKKRKS
jgi:hypothetical protein